MPADLQGQIGRITFTDEGNGLSTAKVMVPGGRDVVCMIGNLTAPMPVEVIKIRGEWTNHPKFW